MPVRHGITAVGHDDSGCRNRKLVGMVEVVAVMMTLMMTTGGVQRTAVVSVAVVVVAVAVVL